MGAHSRPEDLETEPVGDYEETRYPHRSSARYTSTKMFREIEGIHVERIQHHPTDIEFDHQEFAHVRRELAYLRTTVAATRSETGFEDDLLYVRDDLVRLRGLLEEDQARVAILLTRGEELCRQLLDLLAALQHTTRSMNAQRIER